MANSGDIYGSFNGESGGVFSLWVHWYITSQSTSLLRSYINVTWYISKNNASWQTYKQSTPWTLSGYDSGTTSVDLRGVAVNSWQQIVNTDITVQHGSDGRSTIQLSGSLDMSGTSAGVGSFNSGQITLDPIITACIAPTSITASGIITPNGSFTVSWSGAAGGTNNSISGYDIYYKVSSNGTAPTTSDYSGTTSITSTSTSGSQTFSVSSATRGYKIVCGIVVKGGAGSGFYSPIATGGLVTINSLPTAPTVVASRTIIPSTGGSVTFTLNATDVDGQTLTYAYATSASGTKTAIASGGSINSSGATYYFWSKDSLNEYSSSYTTVTITKNTKPAISASTFTPTSYLAQGSAASTNTYVSSITAAATANKTKIQVQLLYGTSSSPSTQINLSDVTVTSGTSTSLGTYNINNLLKDYYTGVRLYFRLQIRAVDSYENGDWVQSSVYSIAATPTTTTTWDSFYNSAEPSAQIVSGYCWNQICIKYLEDASMTSRTVSAKAGTTTITTTKTSEPTSGNYRYLNITLPNDVTGNTVITVTVTLSDGNITKTFTASRTELPVPSLGTFGMNLSTINMYTTTSNINLTCVSPCKFTSNAPVSAADYYIQSMVVNVASNTSGASSRNLTISSATATAAGETLTVAITKANFVSFGDFNKAVYNGTSTGYVRITFINKYGRTFTTGYKAYTLNYNADPTVGNITMQYGSGTSTLTKVQEGLSVKALVNYNASTNSTLTAKLYYQIGSGSWVLASTTTKTIGNQTTTTAGTLTTNTFTIPEVTSTNTWKWKIILTNSVTTSAPESSVVTINAIKHIAPIVNLTNVAGAVTPASGTRTGINLTPTFTTTLNIADGSSSVSPAATTTTTYYIVNGTDDIIISASFNASGATVADTSTDKATWTQKTVRVKCITTATGHTTTTKTGYSNQFTVYLDSPTLAYRKNRLGINTTTPASTAVLDIYTQSGVTLINLHDVSGGMIQLNLVDHTIDII